MKFLRNPECRGCDLWETCRTVCVPTAPVSPELAPWGPGPPEIKHSRALLFIGEGPGQHEDIHGEPFLGVSGIYLRQAYIDFHKLRERVDIYATNTVRCRVPGNDDPNRTQTKACHGYMLLDIKELQKHYEEVIIMVVGGSAIKAVIDPKISLRKAFLKQGHPTDWHGLFPTLESKTKLQRQLAAGVRELAGDDPYPAPCVVFATYHPAFVHRDPSNGLAVRQHMKLVSDYLDGTLTHEIRGPDLEISEAPLPPPPSRSIWRASLDIETYGILKGQNQTMFHPVRSEEFDGIPRNKMVITCAITWQERRGEESHHALFVMSKPKHRRRLWAWIRRFGADPAFQCLIGQNVCFDLMYLRHCYPECRKLLDHPLPIADLLVMNYLHNEGRPERSLKALAPLFKVTEYEAASGFIQYNGEWDPKLWAYNCQDSAATLCLYERLEQEIAEFYGPDTPKLSDFCRTWYSHLLWLIVWMSEWGVPMDEARLRQDLDRYEKLRTGLSQRSKRDYGRPLRGKGSETGKREAVSEAVEYLEQWAPEDMPKLETTKARGAISYGVENRNALLGVLPASCTEAARLLLMGRYQDASKVLDSYLYPLLVGRGKKHDNPDTRLINGIAYPRWFPVPSEWEDSGRGGTKQARIVASGPAVQTFPKRVKRAVRCRFRDGCLIWFDYSQIELRVAALLSNDPVMMDAFANGADLHEVTARLIFGDDIVNHPKFKAIYRQAAKKLNFLVLFWGGPDAFREALMRDVGLDYPLEKCAAAISAHRSKYDTLVGWQYDMLDFARKHGYFELPIIGQSRLFPGGRRGVDNFTNEVVNLPVQAIAADIMLSGQFALWAALKQAKSKAIVPLNVYDAAAVECKRLDSPRVRAIMERVLPQPPFAEALFEHLGRDVPLEYEVTET